MLCADCALPVKTAKAHGTTAKHAGTIKHHVTHKHKPTKAKTHHVAHKKATVHAKTKHATHAKAKGLALGEMVACCTTEALAASLRCQGLAISDEQVLGLFRAAGGDEDKGLPIREALEAASESGLGGLKPRWAPAGESLGTCGLVGADHAALTEHETIRRAAEEAGHGLILGLELPGPHTVLATPDGWWSWGELWCPCEFGDVVIDEAWAVTWG